MYTLVCICQREMYVVHRARGMGSGHERAGRCIVLLVLCAGLWCVFCIAVCCGADLYWNSPAGRTGVEEGLRLGSRARDRLSCRERAVVLGSLRLCNRVRV